MNIGYRNMAVFKVVEVYTASCYYCSFGEFSLRLEDIAAFVKIGWTVGPQVTCKLIANANPRCNYKHSTGLDCERSNRDKTGFTTPNRQNDAYFSARIFRLEMSCDVPPSFSLWSP
mgnify:CR=1 FL=1